MAILPKRGAPAPASIKRTKATIYVESELLKSIKKHVIDTGETLSSFVETAVTTKLKHDQSRAGRKKLAAKKNTDEIDEIIADLAGK